MIPVSPPRKPRTFDRDCGMPGKQWLSANPTSKKFPAYWTKFHANLERGFSSRCGWWAVRITDGAVDHYLSTKNHRRLAYEWSNYRYIAAGVNSSKGNHDDALLDPFEVRAGWFEVILPSMQIVRTSQVSVHLQAKADFTVKQLKPANGYKIRKIRKGYYEDYKLKGLPMNLLRDYAPLVALAVEKWQAEHPGTPLP
jgi:hypothetical protein